MDMESRYLSKTKIEKVKKKNREFVKVCSAKIECKPCKQSYQV